MTKRDFLQIMLFLMLAAVAVVVTDKARVWPHQLREDIDKMRYHSVLHYRHLQVAPDNPCSKCGCSIFNGCAEDVTTQPYFHYFCAHCGYLKCVASFSAVMNVPEHNALWKIKKYY